MRYPVKSLEEKEEKNESNLHQKAIQWRRSVPLLDMEFELWVLITRSVLPILLDFVERTNGSELIAHNIGQFLVSESSSSSSSSSPNSTNSSSSSSPISSSSYFDSLSLSPHASRELLFDGIPYFNNKFSFLSLCFSCLLFNQIIIDIIIDISLCFCFF